MEMILNSTSAVTQRIYPGSAYILIECVASVESWLRLKRLKLNSSKTEMICLGHKNQIAKLSLTTINLDGVDIQRSSSIRDLGVIIDEKLSMSEHISKVVRSSFYQLRQLTG